MPFQFVGDPDRTPKRFVVAVNLQQHGMLRCFKPTSNERYLSDEYALKGVVHYVLKDNINCLDAENTFIDPHPHAISYSQIAMCHLNGQYEYLGSLPEDFRGKIEMATRKKAEWNDKQKREFFNWFGGSL